MNMKQQNKDKGSQGSFKVPAVVTKTPLSPVAEKPIQLKQKSLSADMNHVPDDWEQQEEKSKVKAVTNIQKLARRHSSMKLVQKKKDKLTDCRVMEVLVQDEFVGIAADVLRNTMSNLMQEALHDEFQLDAEPMKFMMKV